MFATTFRWWAESLRKENPHAVAVEQVRRSRAIRCRVIVVAVRRVVVVVAVRRVVLRLPPRAQFPAPLRGALRINARVPGAAVRFADLAPRLLAHRPSRDGTTAAHTTDRKLLRRQGQRRHWLLTSAASGTTTTTHQDYGAQAIATRPPTARRRCIFSKLYQHFS